MNLNKTDAEIYIFPKNENSHDIYIRHKELGVVTWDCIEFEPELERLGVKNTDGNFSTIEAGDILKKKLEKRKFTVILV